MHLEETHYLDPFQPATEAAWVTLVEPMSKIRCRSATLLVFLGSLHLSEPLIVISVIWYFFLTCTMITKWLGKACVTLPKLVRLENSYPCSCPIHLNYCSALYIALSFWSVPKLHFKRQVVSGINYKDHLMPELKYLQFLQMQLKHNC